MINFNLQAMSLRRSFDSADWTIMWLSQNGRAVCRDKAPCCIKL